MSFIVRLVEQVSVVGSSYAIVVIFALVLMFFLIRRSYLRLFSVFLSALSGVYSAALKYIFVESRPVGYIPAEIFPWEKILKSEVYSFPSTHAVLYTTFFGYLLYLSVTSKDVNKVVRFVTGLFCSSMIIFVGASRVLLGAHYVKDVVFGYLFGLIYLAAVIKVERFLEQKLANRPLAHKML